ncbi:MAG: hypothetical protein A2Y22_05040 [Clostridiales bacterium GWD2_32_59]|nr:MAG: hypothetical protein A2Y22_05040 [Clostridiales bacterium GWD2_32_59]
MYCLNIKDLDIDVDDNECLLIFLSEKSVEMAEDIIKFLNDKNIKFAGGIFPSVLNNGEMYNTGMVIKKLPIIGDINLIDMSSESENSYFNNIEEMKGKTLLVLVDGLSTYITTFIKKAFNELTTTVKYIGGGAGNLDFSRKPCVFNKEGIFIDHAIIFCINKNLDLIVEHGWKKLIGPFILNKVNKNIIYEINWKDAFTIYKTAIKDFGESITIENFMNISKGYPLGIERMEGSIVVRDPIAVNEKGELICVSEVSKKEPVYILKGDQEDILRSVENMYETHLKNLEENKNILYFDSISRAMFLEEKFEPLINRLKSYEGLAFDGALTIGQISSYGDGYIEFLNKSLVIGIIK